MTGDARILSHPSHPPMPDTLLTHGGRQPAAHHGLVNMPIYRGSTILADSLEQWESRKTPDNPYASYGRFGTPITHAFEDMLASLEGGYRARVYPSGLAACTHAVLAFAGAGDHVLLPDCVYGPMRAFAKGTLARLGIAADFYDPAIGAGIRDLLQPATRVVYLEAPGSGTFEMQDIPAIAREARRCGAFVVMDNTWATPIYLRPFDLGVDVSIHAATKYIVGHSDAILGVATASRQAWPRLRDAAAAWGQTVGPDELFLALRGLRTLHVRLKRHWESGLALAEMLSRHPMVRRVMHPALPGDPGHALWRRDFTGASGLFAVELQPVAQQSLSVFFSALQLFGIGLSWGGFESLVLPMDPPQRDAKPFACTGPLVRIHAGLESCDDLRADLCQALDAMQRHARAGIA